MLGQVDGVVDGQTRDSPPSSFLTGLSAPIHTISVGLKTPIKSLFTTDNLLFIRTKDPFLMRTTTFMRNIATRTKDLLSGLKELHGWT